MKLLYGRLGVVGILAVLVAAVLQLKSADSPGQSQRLPALPASESGTQLPLLLELGSVSCIPCRMMAPILEEIKTEYAGKLRVDFIDVREDSAAARLFRIETIPTQIVFDSDGTELYRHTGYISKEDLQNKLKELGLGL